jgi:glycosyltransferase involved in cell wall biosynthesis
MNVFQINQSDSLGGAARAAYRIHLAIRQQGEESKMLVNVKCSDDWTVEGPQSLIDKVRARLSPHAAKTIRNLLKTKNLILHSPAIIPSAFPAFINESDVDIVNLHWVAWEMLSISDIAKISKPLVWTLHDMWAFCGAEHYTNDFRWKEGYVNFNRPIYEEGFDLNKWTWERKLKNWVQPFNLVTPSNWLAECVKKSALMRDWPVTVIPNPLDLRVWRPADKKLARDLLGLPLDLPLVTFGALGGGTNPIKGFDLLVEALGHLRNEGQHFELVVFGQLQPAEAIDFGFPIHYLGHLNDDVALRLVYSSADLMVVPSRLEAFGQTASEAQAGGIPVVGFNVGGLRDIVDHKVTGYLATPYDSVDLAVGIEYVLSNSEKFLFGAAAQKRAEIYFDSRGVAQKYINLYESILSKRC